MNCASFNGIENIKNRLYNSIYYIILHTYIHICVYPYIDT